jgi:hypothetical protein
VGEIAGHATGDEAPRVMANARTPALGRHALAWSRVQMLGYLRVHGARQDPQAQLEPQFIGDAPLTPHEVLMRYLPDARWQLH